MGKIRQIKQNPTNQTVMYNVWYYEPKGQKDRWSHKTVWEACKLSQPDSNADLSVDHMLTVQFKLARGSKMRSGIKLYTNITNSDIKFNTAALELIKSLITIEQCDQQSQNSSSHEEEMLQLSSAEEASFNADSSEEAINNIQQHKKQSRVV